MEMEGVDAEFDATKDVSMEDVDVNAKVENVDEQRVLEALPPSDEMPKATYKSFKKKYRKMRIKFDEVMRQSNEYYMTEQKAFDTAKRLALQNDRLLDMLLDMNQSARMPPHHRFDLCLETPSLSAVPGLEPHDEVLKSIDRSTAAGDAIYKEIEAILKDKAKQQEHGRIPSSMTSRSLANMLKSSPTHPSNDPRVSPEILATLEIPDEGRTAPMPYLSLDTLDEHLDEIDTAIAKNANIPSQPETQPPLDLSIRNPHSVYNWLRQNEPKIFLQDGEGSEKSQGKPGALRGAGKRASMPAPSKPDALEFVEEDGLGYDATLTGNQGAKGPYGKRKRDDEDVGYVPKKRNSMDDPAPKPKRKYTKRKTMDSTEATPPAPKRKYLRKEKPTASSPPPPPPAPVESGLASPSES